MNDDLPQCACNQHAQHKTLSECEQIKLNFRTIGFEFKVFLCLFYFLATLRFIEFRCFLAFRLIFNGDFIQIRLINQLNKAAQLISVKFSTLRQQNFVQFDYNAI